MATGMAMLDSEVGEELIVAIAGIFGPLNGVRCHEFVIQNTVARRDQDHLEVHHFSSTVVSPINNNDGTRASEGNPGLLALSTLEQAVTSSSELNKGVVFGIPSIAFHSKSIWDQFYEQAQSFLKSNPKSSVVFCNLVEETVKHVRSLCPELRVIGLLFESESQDARVLKEICEANGWTTIQPPDELRTQLQSAIKSGDEDLIPAIIRKASEDLENRQAHLIIISPNLSFQEGDVRDGEPGKIELLNPIDIFARSLIQRACPRKLTN
eukprot:34996_1